MSDQTVGTEYFREAVERVRLRIRADGQGRPPDVALMLKTLETRFVDPGFDVNELKRLTSPSAATLRAFRRVLACTPAVYLKRCRLALAELALAATSELELTVEEVARAAGYANGRSFARAFREQTGHPPSRHRRPADPRQVLPAPPLPAPPLPASPLPAPPLPASPLPASPLPAPPLPAPQPDGARAAPFRRLVTGELATAAGHDVARRLRLQLCVGSRPLPEEGRVYLSYPGDPHARLVAESLWTVARALPPRQRRALVCDVVRFRSPALFQLLGAASREATAGGDAAAGVTLAELALEVVEEHGAGFGDQLHDLRALAWARLGDARLRAGDLAGAEQAFRFANEAWQTPRPARDAAAAPEIRWLESSLRLAQQRSDDACELVDATIADLRAGDHDPQLLARALTRRALVAERRGDEPETVAALLWEAEGRIDEEAHPALALVTRLHLTRVALDAGHGAEAERLLPRARALGRRVGDGVVQVWLIHVEALVHWQRGDLAAAERLMLQTREAFLERGEIASAALVSIELAKLHDRTHDEARVRQVIAETVPLVESLAVHPKSLAALRQLRSAQADGGELSPELLERIRASIAGLGGTPFGNPENLC